MVQFAKVPYAKLLKYLPQSESLKNSIFSTKFET